MSPATRTRKYEPSDEIVPGFRLVRRLGRGGMGEAWEATSAGGVRVAMKIITNLNESAGRKEFRGLRTVKSIRFPNLCPIFGFWLKDFDGKILDESVSEDVTLESSFDMATPPPAATSPPSGRDTIVPESGDTDKGTEGDEELIRGTIVPSPVRDSRATRPAELIIAMGLGDQTLADRLEQCHGTGSAGIPLDELLPYLDDAARAVDYLNREHKIQHCDIKPGNILLVGGATQVCDFGLARQMDDARRTTSHAHTLAYAPPELLDGQEGPGTDQYSLAITYYELRTGKLPYSRETMTAVMEAKVMGHLDLSGLSDPAERAVIARATERNPADRFESCEAMVTALREALYPAPVGIRWGRVLAVAAILLAIAGSLVYWFWDDIRPRLPLPGGKTASELAAERFDDQLGNGNFKFAAGSLPPMDEGQRRAGAEKLREMWLREIGALKDPRLQVDAMLEATETCSQTLQECPNLEPIVQLRDTLANELLGQMESALPHNEPGQLERAASTASDLIRRLGDTAGAEEIQARIQLVQAMALARQARDPDAAHEAARWGQIEALLLTLRTDLSRLDARRRTSFWLLTAILPQAAADGARRDALAFPTLQALDQLRQSGAELDDWERRQHQAVFAAMRAAALRPDPTMTANQLSLLQRLLPGLTDVHLKTDEARRLLAQSPPDYPGARSQLSAALALVKDKQYVELQPEIELALAQCDLEEPGASLAQRCQALRRAATAAEGASLTDLAQKFVDRVEGEAADHVLAVDDARQAADVLHTIGSRIGGSVSEELTARIHRQLALAMIADPESPPADVLALCGSLQNQGSVPPLIQLGWVEARLLEAQPGGMQPMSLQDMRALRRTAEDAVAATTRATVSGFEGFAHYVAAIAYATQPARDWDRVEDQLSLARKELTSANGSVMQAEGRASRAAQLLELSVADARLPNDRFLPLHVDQKALGIVDRRLRAAVAWRKSAGVVPPLAVRLALLRCETFLDDSTGGADRLDRGEFRQLVDGLLSESDRDTSARKSIEAAQVTGTLQLARAVSLHHRYLEDHRPESAREAVIAFGRALPLFLPPHRRQSDVSDLAAYHRLVQPALELAAHFAGDMSGRTADAGQAAALAQLYLARAELMERSYDVESEIRQGLSKDAIQDDTAAERTVLDSLRIAEKLLVSTGQPVSADCYTLQASLLFRIPFDNAADQRQELQRLAQRALTADPNDPRAQGLNGHVDVLNSRAAGDASESLKFLVTAVEHFTNAVQRASQLSQPEDVSVLLEGRSAAQLEAAFHSTSEAQRTAFLAAAVKDAEEARIRVPDEERHNPSHAYVCLGNAREDQATYLGLHDPKWLEEYASAVEAFEQGQKWAQSNSTRGYVLFNLGRCLLRYAEAGPTPRLNGDKLLTRDEQANMLDRAEMVLKESVDLSLLPSDDAEARYWLSRVYVRRALLPGQPPDPEAVKNQIENAERSAAEAAARTLEKKLPQWSAYQLHWVQLGLARLVRSGVVRRFGGPARPNDPQVAQLAERVKALLKPMPGTDREPALPVSPDTKLEAIGILCQLLDLRPMIACVDDYKSLFENDEAASQAINLKLLRSRQIVLRASNAEWASVMEMAVKDAESARDMAARIPNDMGKFQHARAWGILGQCYSRVLTSTTSSPTQRQEAARQAREALFHACQVLTGDWMESSMEFRLEWLTIHARLIGDQPNPKDPATLEMARQSLQVLGPITSSNCPPEVYERVDRWRKWLATTFHL